MRHDPALVESVLAVLIEADGPLSAREIARACEHRGVSADKTSVNSVLYRNERLKDLVTMDSIHRWAFQGAAPSAAAEPDGEGLNAQQAAVAYAAPEERHLVIAGAGTGKTHTVIEKLKYLTDELGIGGAQGVLVLSFSRAAVAEIRSRLSEVSDDSEAGFIRVVTFDRLAYELISDSAPGEVAWRGYDDSIKRATQLVESGDEEVLARLQGVDHLVVDEVQDLVGCRAEFVLALVDAVGGGFTLLGDPSQGIYGFQIEDCSAEIASDEFFDYVRELPDLREVSFDSNYRATAALTKRAATLGEPMRVPGTDWDREEQAVLDFIEALPCYEAADFVDMATRRGAKHSAILCRTNGQCLLVAKRLLASGVSCTVRRRAEERLVPGWLGIAFGGEGSKSSLTRQRFDESLDHSDAVASGLAFVGNRDAAWSALLRMGRGRTVDLGRVSQLLVDLRIPDELVAVRPAPLVVSTVHRAKGLEFDAVGLYGLGQFAGESEETRVKYVAISRAREIIAAVEENRTEDRRLKHNHLNRWRLRPEGKSWPAEAVEFVPNDMDGAWPPASDAKDAVRTFEFLRDRVEVGDAVRLIRIGQTSRYEVVTNGTVIGHTSHEWANACKLLFRELPTGLSGLFVSDIQTGVGPSAVTESVGLGSSGMWLIPVLGGFAFKEV